MATTAAIIANASVEFSKRPSEVTKRASSSEPTPES